MVTKLREAFLAGGAYAKLVHYPKLIDPSTNTEVDGHQLWSKLTSSIMLDVDGYLRKRRLPTWDYNEIKAIAEKNGIKTPSNFHRALPRGAWLQGAGPINEQLILPDLHVSRRYIGAR
jgi:hypothetical protein